MHALRRYKLRHLLTNKYQGDRGKFLEDAGITKGRLSQLLDEDQPFGETAARNLESRLHLEPGYFDAMDRQTVDWAVKFDALPQHLKERWLDLVGMLGGIPPDEGSRQ